MCVCSEGIALFHIIQLVKKKRSNGGELIEEVFSTMFGTIVKINDNCALFEMPEVSFRKRK